jgi:16S rRNA (uracil1498-N3)-methyltransferase
MIKRSVYNPSVNPRFFAPDARATGDVVTLSSEEGRHLTRVLRLGAGASVRVFNGRGSEFESVVESTATRVSVRVGERREPAPEARLQVRLAQAVLKGDKMDDVVRDAVMMGVASILPVVTTRTEVSVSSLEKGHKRERWERVSISAAKQCGRAVVPAILEPVMFESLTAMLLTSWLAGPLLMLVEPGAAKGVLTLSELAIEAPTVATIVIGPEGGWTPEEIHAGSEVCRLITLGGRTLRADAMALVALSALFARWGEL